MGTEAPSGPTGGSRERRHVLVLDGPDTDPFADPCLDHLTADGADATDVVLVTVTQSSRDRVETFGARLDQRPAKLGVVAVDEQTRGGAGSGPASADRLSVSSVGTPGDLTGLGIAITEYLSTWAGDGNRTVVCIHSLTALLQSVPADRAFEFLNALLSRTASANAAIHVHMNPDAHDEQTFQTISTLFDEVVDAREGVPDPSGATAAGAAGPDDHRSSVAGGATRAPADGRGDPPDPPSPSGGDPDDGEPTTNRLAVLAAVGLVAMVALAGISYAGTGQFLGASPDGGAAALDDPTPTRSPEPTESSTGTTPTATSTPSPTVTATPSPTAPGAPTPTRTPTVPPTPTPTSPDPVPATPVGTPTIPPTPTPIPDVTPTGTPDDGLLDGGDDGLVGNLTDDEDDGLL